MKLEFISGDKKYEITNYNLGVQVEEFNRQTGPEATKEWSTGRKSFPSSFSNALIQVLRSSIEQSDANSIKEVLKALKCSERGLLEAISAINGNN